MMDGLEKEIMMIVHLGDWFVNEEKIQGTLNDLAKDINEMGLKFGLWFEPEMISPKSKLYEEHPDWCIHVPGRIEIKLEIN